MFLSKNTLLEKFDEVYFNFENIPFSSLNLNEVKRSVDGFNFIENGSLFEQLILPFEKTQPHSYDALKNGTFFYAIEKTTLPPIIMGDVTQFGIIINNRACYIRYTPYPYYKEGEKESLKYIPFGILNSWLYNSDCWCMAENTTMNIWKSTLPSLLLKPLHSIIKGFEDNNHCALKSYSDFLESKFNHFFRKSYQNEEYDNKEKYFELRCLLDTRFNNDWGSNGFQLFISSHNNERNIYIVPKSNVMKIKRLSSPTEAIDLYAAHLFNKKDGEFDFMQFAEDF